MPERCQREGATPDGDRLIVDCTVHGDVGSVPAGGDEFEQVEQLFADHVAAASRPLPMPEPTTEYRIEKLRQYYADMNAISGDVVTDPDGQALLAAYDQMAAGRQTWHAKALEMEADRDRLAAEIERADHRAAAAEAAVQRVRDLHSPVKIEVLEWQCHTGRCTHIEDCAEVEVTVCKTCDDIRTDANEESPVVAWPCPTAAALDDLESNLENGEPVHDRRDEPLPAELDWTAEDEAAWRNRRRLANSPVFGPSRTDELRAAMAREDEDPFTPVATSQFISGFQAATHTIEQDGAR